MSGKLTVVAIFTALAVLIGIALLGSAVTGQPDSVFIERRCPDGWATYLDPEDRYSLCYPEGMVVRTATVLGATSVGIAAADSVTDAFGVALHWQPLANAGGPEASCVTSGAPSIATSTTEVRPITVAARSLLACFATSYRDAARTDVGYASVAIDFPVDEGGFVKVLGSFDGPDLDRERDAVLQILDTLRTR